MSLKAAHPIFPEISTVFDAVPDHPCRALYIGAIRNALTKLVPPDFFFIEGKEEGDEEFQRMLPVLRWMEWENDQPNLSVFLLTPHRANAVKFFYEMIHRWLLPGQRVNVSSFFSTDFQLPQLTSEVFTVCEMVISVKDFEEMELIRSHLPILEAEIRFGLVSVYHANRILEIKGLSADEKTSLIQERIASLLGRRPRDFDSDIFSQMQHFLVMCNEEFKGSREYGHMSRIIYVFYLFRKALQKKVEESPDARHVSLKLIKAQLHLPLGTKRVLGILMGINFLSDNEIFEKKHLLKVLKGHFPHLVEIGDSYFISGLRDERIQLLYLEIEKGDGSDFALSELKGVREKLLEDLKNGVECLMSPLFMPRNEEEVMRNIITLSQQLRYPRDLPQVILAFDEQVNGGLSFTIIVLRVFHKNMPSVQELFQRSHTFLQFIPDRIKMVGMLRKKYAKEATVFRVKLPAAPFFRQDHSVDLLKARQVVIAELQRVVGEVRDYNGGMIAKQQEQMTVLKSFFPHLKKREEVLLESFFHSIFPVELRSVLSPYALSKLFLMLLEDVNMEAGDERVKTTQIQEDGAALYVLSSYQDPSAKDRVIEEIHRLHFSTSQLATLSLQAFGVRYLGFIAQMEGLVGKKESFIDMIKKLEVS